MNKNITILGAGLVGSLLATMLRKKNYPVQVYERRGDMRKAYLSAGKSINLAMSTRGWHALEQAGLKNELEQIAIPMYGRQIHNLDGSQTFQPYGKNNEAIYSVSRGDLNKKLISYAENLGVQFTFNAKCNDVNINTNTFNIVSENGATPQSTDLLIGADGAFSALRQAYTSLDKCNYKQHYIEHGYKELFIPATSTGAYALEKNALHIWPRKNFMLIALPNIDGSFTATLFFPYKGETSFETINSDEEIDNLFTTYFANTKSIMPNFVQDYKNNPTSSLVTIHTSIWKHEDKSFIIGDAAHAIVPFYGQGMNAGFEDCTALLKIIEENETENWHEILEQYQSARKINGDAVAQLALNNFIEMRDLVAEPKFIERKKIEKELGKLYPNVYNSVYEMVSFSHTPYSVALQATVAQNNLYNKIINDTESFFDNLNNPAYIFKLNGWLNEYKQELN